MPYALTDGKRCKTKRELKTTQVSDCIYYTNTVSMQCLKLFCSCPNHYILNASMMLHLNHIINDEKLYEMWSERQRLELNYFLSNLFNQIYAVQIWFVKIRSCVSGSSGHKQLQKCNKNKSQIRHAITNWACLSYSRGSGHNVFEHRTACGRGSATLSPAPAFVCVCKCVCVASVCEFVRCLSGVWRHVSNTCPHTSVLMSSLSCCEGPLTKL